MSKLFALLRVFLLCCAAAVSVSAQAEDAGPSVTGQEGQEVVQIDPASELLNMQKMLDKIKGDVSGERNDTRLERLSEMTVALAGRANELEQVLLPMQAQLTTQLSVLGPAQAGENGVQETADVTRKRNALDARKKKIDEQIKQVRTIREGATTLSTQIVTLRRDSLKSQLALNTGGILTAVFWDPWSRKDSQDNQKVIQFSDELMKAVTASWEPGSRVGTTLWLLAALLMVSVGRQYSEAFLAWVGINKLPEGRLRRSFLAVAVALTTLVAVVLAFSFLSQAFTRHNDVPGDVLDFVSKLTYLSALSGLIAGLGNAFLSTRRPSWRLPVISNDVAVSLRSYPTTVACLVFIFQSVEAFNSSAGTTLGTTIFSYGMTALVIGSMTMTISFRWSRVRRKLVQEGTIPEARQTLAGLIQIAITLTGVAILAALVIGYISLARFLSYELVWAAIIFGGYFFLSCLINDVCESLFSTGTWIGKRLHSSLNVDERHLLQAATLLSAFGKTVLLLLAISALLNGTINTSTPPELVQKAVEFWGSKGLSSLNIVPARLLSAFLCLVVGIYVLRIVRRWLDKDFLPKTTMDSGMRVSLLTLFSNIGYVLVILLTLSTLGLQWNKLAWIVSALSVGIGFCLQEIVKNFISGLILLTERPVKVGDLVTISGIEGDIRRINVRATEIQLGDKSTVIVPNSQFISQNVRNATMGNAQGVVSILLTFPLDIDPVKVRDLLLTVYKENERVLDTPEPQVRFKDLTRTGIVLSVTGNVSSQRQIGAVRSDLLFGILARLREEGILLSMYQATASEE